MAVSVRESRTVWTGDVQNGKGVLNGVSGAFKDVEITLPKRAQQGDTTSPEEFLAAAHSSCLAMNLAATLTQNGTPPEELDVTSKVGFGPKDGGGFEIKHANVTIKGKVPGMSEDDFRKLAEQAEQTCPVASLFRGNTEQKVDIQFEG
ncbi:MAG TPA: OsmC family peroxiredoxin [Thermomicrobiales bacterium]|nr:OsmC family peroxiredoxin [Thermomicrobiales bacterium]